MVSIRRALFWPPLIEPKMFVRSIITTSTSTTSQVSSAPIPNTPKEYATLFRLQYFPTAFGKIWHGRQPLCASVNGDMAHKYIRRDRPPFNWVYSKRGSRIGSGIKEEIDAAAVVRPHRLH